MLSYIGHLIVEGNGRNIHLKRTAATRREKMAIFYVSLSTRSTQTRLEWSLHQFCGIHDYEVGKKMLVLPTPVLIRCMHLLVALNEQEEDV